MQRNAILKNQINPFTTILSKSKRLQKWQKMVYFFGPRRPNFDPFFTISFKWLINMCKYIISKNQKKSFTRKNFKSKNCKNSQELLFFGPTRPNCDPFFTIFCKWLLNKLKNTILKNQKNTFTGKISKSEKVRKWPKKGQKLPFFGPGGPNFDPFFTIFFANPF